LIYNNLRSKAPQLVFRNKLHATSVRLPTGSDGILRHTFGLSWLAIRKNRPLLAEIIGNSAPVITKHCNRTISLEQPKPSSPSCSPWMRNALSDTFQFLSALKGCFEGLSGGRAHLSMHGQNLQESRSFSTGRDG